MLMHYGQYCCEMKTTGIAGGQRANKDVSIFKMIKGFRPPFSKGGAVEAAEASSRSAEREIFSRRFSVC